VKALVTGATGLVGSHIVRALVRRGHSVRALRRASSDCAAIDGLPIEIVHGDVLTREGLDNAAAECDVVFHAAADFAYWGKSREALLATAVSGTANILEVAASAGVGRVVITSSSVVLGYSDGPTARDEESPALDDSSTPYDASKIRQDQRALEIAAALDLDVVLVCPTVVVGPFAPTLGPSNAVLTTYLADPLRLTYPGGCNILSAADAGEGHVVAAMAGTRGERYVLGGENLEWRTIHSTISELCGTYGPLMTANHSACYVAALGEEMRALVSERAPTTTRTQAQMVGRYYWYSHDKAARIGFRPGPARDAMARALSWLVATDHVSRETRSRLRLSDEVWSARRMLRINEAALRPSA
jgi:dihydroflavonol-4-reductase